MNNSLKREIILNIFQVFNVGVEANPLHKFNQDIVTNEFLLPEILKFNTEQTVYERRIWGGTTTLEDGGKVNILIADLSEENFSEYVVLLQLNEAPPYALRLSSEEDDSGVIMFPTNKEWIHASTLLQAKLLVAVESLLNLLIIWQPLKSYHKLHQTLINYLSFDSETLEK